MADLLAFLRQCLSEDERVIREAVGDYFYAEGHGSAVNRWFDRWRPDNPDGMIAEVKAKRRILEYCEAVHERGKVGPACGDGAWFLAVRLLIQPYAGWPGWRDEWAA